MRDRLVAALVGMAIAMITLYGIPRAYQLADIVTSQENRKAVRSADLIAVVVTERRRAGAPVDDDFLRGLLNEGEGVEVVASDATVVRAGVSVEDPDDIVEVRPLPDGSAVTFARSRSLVDERVSDALRPLIVLGLALVPIAAGVGFVLARRFSRPFGELAVAAEDLGRGRFDMDLPRYSIPEADAIGAALTRASGRLDELVEREREFASNVSHQLRTPVAGLRLALEDLSMWPETPQVVAAELGESIAELDRLGRSITEILDLSRGKRLGDAADTNLSELVAEAVARWTPRYAAAGRELVHDPTDSVVGHVVPGPVEQVLDVLLDNALLHGKGRVVAGTRDLGKSLQVGVVDEGERKVGGEVFQRGESSVDSTGHGLGLTIASHLARSLGGYLTLADAPTTTFVLVLPPIDTLED